MTILSTQGIEGIGVAIESFAAMQRPVLYFSLREATSSRDLHMAMLLGGWTLREVHGIWKFFKNISGLGDIENVHDIMLFK